MNKLWRAFLQTTKLACKSFIDAGKRHDPPVSETKDRVLLSSTAVTDQHLSQLLQAPGLLWWVSQ